MKRIMAFTSTIWVLLLAGCTPPGSLNEVVRQGAQPQPPVSSPLSANPASASMSAAVQANSQEHTPSQPGSSTIFSPLSNAKTRVTKKTFGMYITPKTSPVQPERFSGYHTGVDFETSPDEQNVDVPVYAICSGPLLQKKWATGYGGVMVQQCTIANETVTVIYGHIRLNSITFTSGENIEAGKELGVLGTGYSTETDGERKHLHLGIHKGTSINILGYVQKKSGLGGWIDAQKLLQ